MGSAEQQTDTGMQVERELNQGLQREIGAIRSTLEKERSSRIGLEQENSVAGQNTARSEAELHGAQKQTKELVRHNEDLTEQKIELEADNDELSTALEKVACSIIEQIVSCVCGLQAEIELLELREEHKALAAEFPDALSQIDQLQVYYTHAQVIVNT